jgi:RimJ/RimL family protein N-acetyltransferase
VTRTKTWSDATITLRGWREDDVASLAKLRNDTDLQEQLMSRPRPNTADMVRQWLARRSRRPENVFLVIEDTRRQEIAGYVQYINVDAINGTAEFGICIAPDFQGQGHAGAAMVLAERCLREEFNGRKVVLKVLASNTRAIRLYKRQGFEKCGLLRSQFLQNGAFQDVVIMEKFIKSPESG